MKIGIWKQITIKNEGILQECPHLIFKRKYFVIEVQEGHKNTTGLKIIYVKLLNSRKSYQSIGI